MKRAAIIVSILALVALGFFVATGSPGVAQLLRGGDRFTSPTLQVTAVFQPTVKPTSLPAQISGDTVVAQGKLVPIRYVNLSFNTGGLVVNVSVNEGETVKAGQLIAHLSNQEQYQATVATAQLELVNAQQVIKDLYDNAPYAAAQTLQALVQAPNDVQEAQRILDNLQGGTVNQTDIDIAQANMALAEKKLSDAQAAYAPWANKPADNLVRASLLNKLSQAQQEYDAAQRRYSSLVGGPTETKISQAQADLALAKAKQAEAERKYEILKNGPNPDDVALAQARLKNAEIQLNAAQAALTNLELRAPFTGTVATLSLKQGEYVAPGVPILLLVDTSQWRVETIDLTELNIVRVKEGATATITFDSLPEIQFPAKVYRIKTVGENRQGDITYTVILDIGRVDERLRWNMTCSVMINTE